MTEGQRLLLEAKSAAQFRRDHGLSRSRYDALYHRAREAQYALSMEERAGPEAFWLMDRFGTAMVNSHRVERHVRRLGA